MAKIQESMFIELYNAGKDDIELSKLFSVGERGIRRYALRLRKQGKIKYRKDLAIEKKEKTKFNHQEVFEEVKVYVDNAKTVLANYNDIYASVKLKEHWDKNKQKEDMALVWSDMHTGMINKHPLSGEITYNEKIQEEELQALLRGVVRFQQLYKPSYNIETLYIFDAGDNITNDRIYEGQQAEITCGVGEQILKAFNYQSDFIKKILEYFPNVKMIKVPGNHARTTARYISEEATNSFEYLLGQLLIERFKNNPRVEITVPDRYRYTMEIRGHKYLLFHGNAIRGATLNSIERAVKDLATLAYKEFYDAMIIGHFHTALKLKITPETTLLVNGCFTKETPILMGDFSTKNIRDIQVGDEVVGFKKAKRGYNLIKTKVKATTKRIAEVFQLKFNDRLLNITEEHPIYSYEKLSHRNKSFVWKFPYENNIMCLPVYNAELKQGKNKEWKRGYLAGFLDGDGTVCNSQGKTHIHYYNNDISLLTNIINYLEELLDTDKKFTITKNKGNTKAVQFAGKNEVKQFLEKLAAMPSASFKRGYLAGVFDAEGCLANHQIMLFNTNPTIINKIERFAKDLNLQFSVNWKVRENVKRKKLGVVILSPCIEFWSLCEPNSAKKRNLIVYNQTANSYYKNKIIKKESYIALGKKEVYNFETEAHTYIANGIPVHNCFVDMDDYAYNKLRKFSSATQYLFNISKKSPLHNLQEINLKWK